MRWSDVPAEQRISLGEWRDKIRRVEGGQDFSYQPPGVLDVHVLIAHRLRGCRAAVIRTDRRWEPCLRMAIKGGFCRRHGGRTWKKTERPPLVPSDLEIAAAAIGLWQELQP